MPVANSKCLFCKKARLGVSTLKIVQYRNDCKIEAVTKGKPLRHSAPQDKPNQFPLKIFALIFTFRRMPKQRGNLLDLV